MADFVTVYIAEVSYIKAHRYQDWSSLLVKQYGQAHPAERGHFKVGGEGGNYDIDSHANIEDRCKDILC